MPNPTKIQAAMSFEDLELTLTQLMGALSAEARLPQRSEGEQARATFPCPPASPTSTSRKRTEEAMQQNFSTAEQHCASRSSTGPTGPRLYGRCLRDPLSSVPSRADAFFNFFIDVTKTAEATLSAPVT